MNVIRFAAAMIVVASDGPAGSFAAARTRQRLPAQLRLPLGRLRVGTG
jgi:hypothetical protein